MRLSVCRRSAARSRGPALVVAVGGEGLTVAAAHEEEVAEAVLGPYVGALRVVGRGEGVHADGQALVAELQHVHRHAHAESERHAPTRLSKAPGSCAGCCPRRWGRRRWRGEVAPVHLHVGAEVGHRHADLQAAKRRRVAHAEVEGRAEAGVPDASRCTYLTVPPTEKRSVKALAYETPTARIVGVNARRCPRAVVNRAYVDFAVAERAEREPRWPAPPPSKHEAEVAQLGIDEPRRRRKLGVRAFAAP